MFLKSSNILPLLNSEEFSFDFSAAMLYLLVWWICVYSRKICEGLWCDWNEAETGDECLGAKVGWETHYHTTLQTSHTSSPLTHLSQQLQHQSLSFSLSSVSLNSSVFACPVQLCDWMLLLWFSERASAQAYCYSSRCLCLKCSDCSAVFLMLMLCSGQHLITHTRTVCCCILNHFVSGK